MGRPPGEALGREEAPEMTRLLVDGRFLTDGAQVVRLKGVTYGSFAMGPEGVRFPEWSRLKQDFTDIASRGFNTVRTYTVPSTEMLDLAAELGLRLIVGIDHHDWRLETQVSRAGRGRIERAGLEAIDDAMARLAGRPEVAMVAVGNEIPADLVRVFGARSVARTLGRFIERVHELDPDMLVTYVNYPTTEFLEVPGQDVACFNVFLEEPGAWRRYVRHLEIVAGERPLVLTELGLASEIHGHEKQAETLGWQLRMLDESGCAGGTVFSWTDEWAVGDEAVTGWGFGLTDEARRPKPALEVAETWARRAISEVRDDWPTVSAVVCAYNEQATIAECLDSLMACTYPALEVIVCDDGSTDRTRAIMGRYPFTILDLPHGGLSRARNAGLEAATGVIVAYLDADAACHPEWPYHLALSLEDDGVVASGGPNLAFEDVGAMERAVAVSPGGPREVLIADDRAEHVPGCNMAFRKDHLVDVGGFDDAFVAAGDDVDVCWKLLDRGHEIAFAPAAQTRHHRRATLGAYLRQQLGYGRAERMLAGAHPHRFNRLGQARWRGVIYGGVGVLRSLFRPIVYRGIAGTAPFQPVVRRPALEIAAWVGALLPLTVPIALVGALLAWLSPWWLVAPVAALAVVIAYGVATAAAVRLDRRTPRPLVVRTLVGVCHVLQPLARTWGRIRSRPLDRPDRAPVWRGDRSHWVEEARAALATSVASVQSGGSTDPWDLRASLGPMIAANLTLAVVWGWEPRWSVRYRLRWWGVALAAAGIVATVPLGSAWPWVAAAAAVALTFVEYLRVGARLRGALATTTRGSQH